MYSGINEYAFQGIHAQRVVDLVSNNIFKRNIDVLTVAPIVGFQYSRTAELDKSADYKPTKVFLAQLQAADAKLEVNYKSIVLLDEEYEADQEERFKKAFQVSPENRAAADLERYESYVRGGVDVLFEKLIGEGDTQEDRLQNLFDLVETYSNRYQLA